MASPWHDFHGGSVHLVETANLFTLDWSSGYPLAILNSYVNLPEGKTQETMGFINKKWVSCKASLQHILWTNNVS